MSGGNGNLEMGKIMARRQSVVEATGMTTAGEEVVQAIVLEHDPDALDTSLLGTALGLVRQAGGLLVNGPGGTLEYYHLVGLQKVRLAVRKVALATGAPARPLAVQ